MFSRPVNFHEYLTHHGLIDDVYKTMHNPDLSETVLTVLDIMKKTKKLQPLVKDSKTEEKSTIFRKEGNQAYGHSRYQLALICYNKALLYAPKNSRAMKLVYSNRSALLHKLKAFSACLNDIDTCFSLGCPLEIIEKLRKRKEDAKNCLWLEKMVEGLKYSVFSETFFNMDVKRNPMIPCASADVEVITDSQSSKVVAATDIKVGAVLAVETAFVSHTDEQNTYFSCYYCHKMSFNLIPCEKCVFALFCDEDCKEKCMYEYHDIECQIMEVLDIICTGSIPILPIEATLKLKKSCKSWKEFISASYETGIERLQNSQINQIYDVNYKFSLLNCKDERHFFNGPVYNSSFTCATIISYLENIQSFFPLETDERTTAIKAFARIYMFLSLYSTNTQIISSVSICLAEKTEFHPVPNFGWFSFVGKLKNSCNSNVLAVGLNKQIALVAIQPIKRGSELTIPYVGHWLDQTNTKEMRHRNMFMLHGIICNCLICTEDYKLYSNNYTLTEIQKKSFHKLNVENIMEKFNARNMLDIYMKLCKTMAFLSDLPFSEEYTQVYKLFRRCILHLQDITTSNVLLDYVFDK